MKKFLGNTALIVLGIFFVLYNILALVIPSSLALANMYFWVAYAFTNLAFILVAGVLLVLKLKKHVIFSVLMPCYVAAILYFLANVVMNAVYMVFLYSYPVNKAAAILPNIVVLLLFLAAFVIGYRMILHVKDRNEVIDKKVAANKLMVVEIGQIAALAQDADVKKALAALKEDADYSDPMGVAGTAALEDEFNKKIVELRVLVEGNYEPALILTKIAAAKNKLQERNQTLRSLK